MRIGVRLTLGGLGLVLIVVVIGTTVVPTHVTLGAGSLRCGMVLSPDRNSEIGPLCDRAGVNHLRAVLVIGAILTAIALAPLAVAWRRPGRHGALSAGWAAVMLVGAVVGVAVMGWFVEYAPESVFFDL